VTATLGTEKTYRSSKVKRAKVVWVDWFWKSVALWDKQDEGEFLTIQSDSRNASGTATPAIVVDEGTEDKEREGEGVEFGEEEGELAEEGDAGVGEGWDEDAQADMDAFLEGSSDFDVTEDGRTDVER